MLKGTRKNRHLRLRKKISGTQQKPRLVVTRSLRQVVAQIVDDTQDKTLVSVNSYKILKGTKIEKATKVGKDIAKKALDNGIKTVVFDRGGNKYHGRVKAVATAARENGLEF